MASRPSAPSVASVPLQDLDYSGDQSALIALDREINAAGTDATKLAAIESRLVALLRRTDGTVAARQAACQRLGLVFAASGEPALSSSNGPSSAALTVLKEMLLGEQETDIARLALEPVPGAAIDALLLEALAKTSGRTRLGLLQTIATRRTASAVPALRALLANTDAATSSAAATALGQIGGADALAALQSAPGASATVIEAELTVARTLPVADAVALLGKLQRDQSLPAYRRAAALRSLLDFEPAAATTRLTEALAGGDWALKEAAIEAVFSSPAPDLVGSLAAKLPTWDDPTQAAVLAALGNRADAKATGAIVAATKHADASVRAAAITALGRMPGDRELALVLIRLVTGEKSDEAKLARASLARLHGPGVSAAVLAGAEKSEPAHRAAFIELLAARNLTEGLPLLRNSRRDADATVRAAAVGALGDLAPASDQGLILEWAAGATDSAEQSRALRALVNVTLRNPDTAKRALPVYQLLEKAEPAVAVRLMPVLTRFGDQSSAECAARLALGSNATVADAATGTLTRWPDRTAQPSLVTVAAKAIVASARTAAAQAALRYFERIREPWSPDQTSLVSQLLDVTTDTAVRKRLVTLLYRAADKDALALAEKLRSESAVADAAKEAALCITANLAGPPKARVSASEGSARNLFDGKTATDWRVPVTPDQWVEVDFKQARPLHRLTLDETGRTTDYPERYAVFVTDDLDKPGKAVVTGAGQRNRTVIDLPTGTKGRYVIIKNTAERIDAMWSICELFVD